MSNSKPSIEKKIFEVTKKLECAYPGRGKVLEVSNLDICQGEIVVIIGNSGAGKSTLIETLGLMTDTLSKTDENEGSGQVKFSPKDKDDVLIPDVWHKGNNGEEVTRVRRENFNFIFQDNNLMFNLRNDENVILADLIDGKFTKDESEKRTEKTFKSLNIPKNVGENSPMNISGGERQRVAFARGIQPEFNVLFGDEPTGNLDEENSENLMGYLQDQIPENSEERAAIIVSHNIDLALKFADKIIILTRYEENGFYEILPDYVFTRESRDSEIWEGEFPIEAKTGTFPKKEQQNLICKKDNLHHLIKNLFSDIPSHSDNLIDTDYTDKVDIRSLKDYIKYILKKNVEGNNDGNKPNKVVVSQAVKWITWIGMAVMSFRIKTAKILNFKKYLSQLDISEYFSRLLFEKECEQLAGKNSSSIWFLSISIFITFMILGLANGQLDDLRNDLMKDPFVLTIDVLHRGGDMQKETRKILNNISSNPDTMDHYMLDQISEYDRNYLTFYDFKNPQKSQFYLGRSMRYDDPMIARILSPDINPGFLGRGFNSSNDIGLVVEKDLLKDLNYDLDSPVIYCRVYNNEEKAYLSAPIPIIAVIDHLPGRRKNYFLYTPNFYDYYQDEKIAFPFKENRKIKIAARIGIEQISEMKEKIELALKKLEDKKIPNFRGVKKIEIDTNLNFQEKIFEFIIYPKKNNRNLFDQKALIDSLFNSKGFNQYLSENELIPGKDIFQAFYFDVPMMLNVEDTEKERGNISFLFKDPAMIKDFAKMFTDKTRDIDEKKKEGILMDLGKVESMFIFHRISSLTTVILFVLIIVIVIANMQYIYNLLNFHLYKIRRNIGTLMAFGININIIYRFLLFSFVLFCFIIPFALANIVGYLLLDYTGIISFILYSAINEQTVWLTILTTMFIFFGSYLVYFVSYIKYFTKKPSELIYSRIKNDFWVELRRKFFGEEKKVK